MTQNSMNGLVTIKEASIWASGFLNKNVTSSNISYLVQYGRINKYSNEKNTLVSLKELNEYYALNSKEQEFEFNNKIKDNINHTLTFKQFKESDTTKHVHRIHPYKGKFIPQLVEYFLDSHIDEFKKDIFFKKNDLILDPFCGSGTTLVQANELGLNAVGIDISEFNALISNSKLKKIDINDVKNHALAIRKKLKDLSDSNLVHFDNAISIELKNFNAKYFPAHEFKRKVVLKEIDDTVYGEEKLKEFNEIYYQLIKQYEITLKQKKEKTFLDKWFLLPIRNEIEFIKLEIGKIKNEPTKQILQIILSRTVRSSRATTHSDLATLKKPTFYPYYCKKHGKICRPVISLLSNFTRYYNDTIKRFEEFEKYRTNAFQQCVVGDSRDLDIFNEIFQILKNNNIKNKKFDGIFTSPPYVGVIDYHEQHAYSYELFNFKRKDELEIGPLYHGQTKQAIENYKNSMVKVLDNCKKYLKEDFNIFIVANDKFNIYPEIVKLAKMQIVQKFERPVLNRTERNRSLYTETIFHIKKERRKNVAW